MRAAVRWSGLVDEGSDDDYVLGNSEKKEKLKREREPMGRRGGRR